MSNNFLNINLNQALALKIFHFDDCFNNIDWLCNQAIGFVDAVPQLNYYTLAINLCEKFHSYFHFEQSFFHLTYADILFDLNNIEEASQHYVQAIFQDHLNQRAHIRLLSCFELLKQQDKYDSYYIYAQKLNINLTVIIDITEYKRPFENFIDYLKFATNSKFLNSILDKSDQKIISPYDYLKFNDIMPFKVNNFWLRWLKFRMTNNLVDLENTIILIKAAHESYHQNSAKIYFNRSIIYKKLGEEALSNNDLFKAQNLWSNLP